MRHILHLLLLIAGVTFAESAAAGGREISDCRMSQCTHIQFGSPKYVAANGDDKLFRVTSKLWISQHPKGDYHRPRKRRYVGTEVRYVLCSRSRPATLGKPPSDAPGLRQMAAQDEWNPDEPPPWYVEFLAPGQSVIDSARATHYATYFFICHRRGPTMKHDALLEWGRALGYHIDPERHGLYATVKDPKDALTVDIPPPR